jgi:hypothetical protein
MQHVHAMLKEDCSTICTVTAEEVRKSIAGVFHTLTKQLGKGKV